MSMRLMVSAMKARVGSSVRKLVLIKLADNANDNGECWPSYRHIAEHCELSRSTVKAHIRALRDAGFLRIEERRDGKSSNRYWLHIDQGTGATVDPVDSQPGRHMPPTGATHAPHGGDTCPLNQSLNQSQNRSEENTGGRARESVNTEQESNTNGSTTKRFEEFWSCYPKGHRKAKKRVKEIWQRKRLDERADEILADLMRRPEQDDQWRRGFIPNPSTYLNQERWEDDYQQPQQAGSEYDGDPGRRSGEAAEAYLRKQGLL